MPQCQHVLKKSYALELIATRDSQQGWPPACIAIRVPNTGRSVRFLLVGVLFINAAGADSAVTKPKGTAEFAGFQNILWAEPTDITQRDLFYGSGGRRHAPASTKFQFLSENRKGSSPKFDVRDSAGINWTVKQDVEARPETVATRLVWAAGYRTQEDYFLSEIQVTGLPSNLRGRDLIKQAGLVPNVRLERESDGLRKIGIWSWKDSPVTGTREWNGLRVLMALINNWDLKDNNNGVFTNSVVTNSNDPRQRIYMITDLGASFGTNGIGRGHLESRGNLTSYQHSRFITHVDSDRVDFATPDKAPMRSLLSPPHYVYRLRLRWLGRNIPRQDAKWIGGLLARLSKKQIRDAFRAAGYESATAEAFAQVVESRIAALNAL